MAASSRLTMGPRKSTARQPLVRPPPARAQSMAPSMPGRATPTESAATTSVPTKSPARSVNGGPAGIKRKERDFEQDVGVEEETNINVVVRCRGRSDREVRENSGVVVSTEGVKGKKVDLSMGPSALSNKTYNFDKVFSPAADQEMIFNEVVSPILDEVRIKRYDAREFGLTFKGTWWLQLYDIRLWTDGHGKDVHNVR